MKPRRESDSSDRRNADLAFSTADILVVVATAALLFGLFLPRITRGGATATRISCVNNLRAIGSATRSWAIDQGAYPSTVSNQFGGTLEYTNAADAYRQFVAFSAELGSPKILVCPDDATRKPALDFTNGFGNHSISYFIGIDLAEDFPAGFLAGDRNLSTNSKMLTATLLTISTNTVLQATRDLHDGSVNIGLADGSVLQLRSSDLQRTAEFTTNRTQRLLFP